MHHLSIQGFVRAPLIVAMLAGSAVAAPGMQDLQLVKECSQYTGEIPSYCTITSSNLAAIPVGSKVFYFGPELGVANPSLTSTMVIIDAGSGNLAPGYCILDQRNGQEGMCAFVAGSGMLTGFNAIVRVTMDDAGLFHWDGGYGLAAPGK